MTTGRHGPQLDPETVLETITTLADAGETIACEGGVHAAAITERVPFTRSTVHKRCVELVDDGKIREVRGLKDGRPAVSYLPTEDDERELRADGGTRPADRESVQTGPDGTCWYCEDAAPGALANVSVGPLGLTVAVCHDCDDKLEAEHGSDNSDTEADSQ